MKFVIIAPRVEVGGYSRSKSKYEIKKKLQQVIISDQIFKTSQVICSKGRPRLLLAGISATKTLFGSLRSSI